MRPLVLVLLAQIALGAGVVGLVLTGNVPFTGPDEPDSRPVRAQAPVPCAGGLAPRPTSRSFDGARAYRLLRLQLRFGPRPAGSPASRRLAGELRARLPRGRYQAVPGGLRNVVGHVSGRGRGRWVVGAHYDTKDLPGFVGANDGASGTAVVMELARALRRRPPARDVTFVLFDGEESPRGVPDGRFLQEGLRGSKVAARRLRSADAMVLLDFVGDRDLSIPREGNSDPELWSRLRAAARGVGVGCVFPAETQPAIADDHIPFIEAGVPAIDLIDFDFPCWHESCDDLSAVSQRSLDAVGEAVLEMLRRP
jgi:hypothetical protein